MLHKKNLLPYESQGFTASMIKDFGERWAGVNTRMGGAPALSVPGVGSGGGAGLLVIALTNVQCH